MISFESYDLQADYRLPHRNNLEKNILAFSVCVLLKEVLFGAPYSFFKVVDLLTDFEYFLGIHY